MPQRKPAGRPFATPTPRTVPANSVDLGVLDTGEVVIQFGELIRQMTFTPEQARKIGQGFIEMATKCEILHPTTLRSEAVNRKSKVF